MFWAILRLLSVFDVGQDFYLVPERFLLLRGFDLTSRLLSNGLIQEQSYRRAKSYSERLVESRDEVVLWSVPSLRFRRVNYFKWDMLYQRYQVDMRKVTIQHWKYKRKGLLVESMQSGELRQDNDLRSRGLKYSKAEATKVSRGRDEYSVPRPRQQEHTESIPRLRQREYSEAETTRTSQGPNG
jgi:hypothetical protein